MSIIRLKEANCRNCYKCIRECPVKSISFKGEQAHIIDQDCVLCGHCLYTCPQHAKEIVSDVEKVRALVRGKNRVYVSLAPSYPSYFKGISIGRIAAALKKMGVVQVEETAVGATKVSLQYEELMNRREMKNIITTACPSVVLLVQKYYPDLLPYLAPVASPLLAHAKTIKEVYGARSKVVFIGPCIAKKHEAEDVTNDGLVSAALTFEEFEEWMKLENVQFEETDEEQRGIKSTTARFYPVPGGILKTIGMPARRMYRCVGVDGMDRCIQALDALRSGELTDHFIEMNACAGACIAGPSLKHVNFFGAKDDLLTSIAHQNNETHYLSDDTQPDIQKRYIDLSHEVRMPTEEEIKEILAKIGKHTKEDELNCGCCGYPSCREKAIAVFQGKAEEEMCMPYMREKAESMSNVIIDSSPNSILALDASMCITQINPAACQLLGLQAADVMGKHIEEVLPSEMYYDFGRGSHDEIRDGKQTYDQYGIIVEQTVVRVAKNDSMIVILKDITEEESSKQQAEMIRKGTIEITQKVIDKQMRVAQEIASLLGETTAETKVALTRLKKSMEDGGNA